jgi:deazaflavin-dependent oxidoreductase (nitroreductase family)
MPQTINYFKIGLHVMTGGLAFQGKPSDPAGFLKLTTVGRKSGQARTVRLVYIRDGDAYALAASNAGKPSNPGWFFNLQAHPEVTIEAHGVRQSATAEVADPARREELWARLTQIAPQYKGYETRTQRVIPMVVVRPHG